VNDPATLFWLLCGALGMLALALLSHFVVPAISAPVAIWLVVGVLLLAHSLGRGDGS
jgi:hypothetical protein